jgi:hypothetical protein
LAYGGRVARVTRTATSEPTKVAVARRGARLRGAEGRAQRRGNFCGAGHFSRCIYPAGPAGRNELLQLLVIHCGKLASYGYSCSMLAHRMSGACRGLDTAGTRIARCCERTST